MGPKNVNKKNMNEFYGRLTKSHAFLKVCSLQQLFLYKNRVLE